jgi:hypothetical protein
LNLYVDLLVRNPLFVTPCACIMFLFLAASTVCEYYTVFSEVL